MRFGIAGSGFERWIGQQGTPRPRGVVKSRRGGSLEEVARLLRPSDVAQEKATERINFLVSPSEKEAIWGAAEGFGLTITDYLLRLHRLTVSMMAPKNRRRIN